MAADPQLELLVSLGPFQGVNTWTSRIIYPQGYLTDARNVEFSATQGSVSNILGREVFNTTAISSGILGIGRFPDASSGNPITVIAKQNAWSYLLDNSTSETNIAIDAWNAGDTYFASMDRVLIAVNGIDAPKKLVKGSLGQATRAGIVKPTSAPSVAEGPAGNLNGTYRYRVTYETSTHESSPGPMSEPISVINRQVGLTNIPTSPDTTVIRRNIYRLGGAVPEWRLVGTIHDNSTTTAIDDVKDADLTDLLVFDRDPPPVGLERIIQHRSQIFGSKGNELFFSNFEEPEGWNVTNVFKIGDASKIVALASTGSILLVFKSSTTYAVYGSFEDDLAYFPAFAVGCIAPRSAVSAPGLVCWLAEDGIRMSNGQDLYFLGDSKLKSLIDSIPLSTRRSAVGVFGESHYLLSFPGLFTVVYDFFTQSYSIFSWTFLFAAPAFEDSGTEQFILVDQAAPLYLRRWPSSSYSDLGNPQNWYIEREDITCGDPFVKRFRGIIIEGPRQSGVTATLTLTVDGDTANKSYTRDIDLGTLPQRLGLPANMIGRRITVRLSGTHSTRVQIDNISLIGHRDREYTTDA